MSRQKSSDQEIGEDEFNPLGVAVELAKESWEVQLPSFLFLLRNQFESFAILCPLLLARSNFILIQFFVSFACLLRRSFSRFVHVAVSAQQFGCLCMYVDNILFHRLRCEIRLKALFVCFSLFFFFLFSFLLLFSSF